jgi:hypothetical protein
MSVRDGAFSRRLFVGLLALALLLIVVVRVRLLGVPLERDEGEYAYIGSLLLQGVPPYAEAWNMKFPGIYAVYALLIGVGGSSVAAIHAGLLVASVWNAMVCALLGRRLLGPGAGLVAGVGYGAMSVSTTVLGLWSHAEPFALTFALPGLLLALDARRAGRYAAAGLLLGAAVLVKQNAAPLALFAALWVALREAPRTERPARALAAFALGGLLPLAAVAAGLAWAGVFGRFWLWTVRYASEYGSLNSWREGLDPLGAQLGPMLRAQLVWWVAAGVGLVAPLWERSLRERAPFLWGLLAAGAVSSSLGFYFRPQYFVPLLPAVALLAGAGSRALAPASERGRLLCCALVALVGLGTPLGVEADLLWRKTPEQVSRAIYWPGPFAEAPELGRRIAEIVPPGQRIAVIGSEPEIYFHAGRRAATGYLYVYPLMEPQPFAAAMQEELIAQLEAARPEVVVYVNAHDSWGVQADSLRGIFHWLERWQQDFEPIAIADLISPEETRWVLGDEARRYEPGSPHWVSLLRRKERDRR